VRDDGSAVRLCEGPVRGCEGPFAPSHFRSIAPHVLSLLIFCSVARPALGQDSDPEFATRDPGAGIGTSRADAQVLREVGAAAARAGEAKTAFVTALRALAEGLPGARGDEGARIRTAVADMRAALKRWDDALGSFRATLETAGGSADVRVALGTAYLERGLTSEAIDQFRRAVALAPRWGEASLLLALAYRAQDNRQQSARALTTAARATPDSPAIAYANVQQAVATDDESEITRTLLAFRDRYDRVAPATAGATPSTPFVRIGLLRETPGVAPVFVPARYADGFRLLHAGRYDEAVAMLQQAIERDPLAATDDTLDERVHAAAALRDGSLTDAIARLERAVVQRPDATELRRILAVAYAGDERYGPSLEQLSAAIQRDGRDERSRLTSVEILIASGQTDAAERMLVETIAVLPESAQAHYRLARLYQAQSRIQEAIAAFTSSAERPVLVGRDFLYETIAALRVSEGEFSDAITASRMELEVNPNNAAAHRRLGDLYAQEGRLGESLAEFAAALLIDPRDADTHASRAQTLLRMSRFADAVAAARTAVSLRPSHEAAHYALGTALLRTGKTDEGLATLQKFEQLQATARARRDAEWQLKLLKEQAVERAARQDYRAAAELLRRAVAYAPSDGSVHLAAGALLIKAGEYEEAIPLLKEAVAREAQEAHRYLAEAYGALHRDDESRAHQAAYDAVKVARLRRSVAIQ
jgi:tetratricopeptide (TPR) repeat protein